MNPTLIEYLGFVVAALILGWAIIEIRRRYLRQRRVDSKPLNTWVTLDSTLEDDIEKSLPAEESDEDEESVAEANIQIRAQHNGYHSESKKLL
ncbi:MAG TPA: hypothetical protein VNW73_02380 [Ktedonobacteraceae bacterium]|jgi:hypothetical protein|nr:hypothetical protein [Ktedonobacteraceae bacterium]